MAKQLMVTVAPTAALAEAIPQRLFARLKYTREVSSEDPDDAAPQTINLPGSHREELSPDGKASFQVDDYADETPAVLQVEYAQGSILWESDELAPWNDAAATLDVDIPAEAFAAMALRKAPPGDSAVLLRAGRFVRLDDAMLDTASYRLFVAPIRPNRLPDRRTNPQTAVVRQLLGLPDGGEVTTFEAVELDVTKLAANSINTLGLQSARVHPDGVFDVSIDIMGDEIAWLWLLLGPTSYAGYQLDPIATQPRANMVIVLPLAQPPAGAGAGAVVLVPGGGAPAAGGNGQPPLEFDERQLLEHPDKFSDDPGAFCAPFDNPYRIVGERRFFTVLRVDQPEIGGQASLVVSRPMAQDLVPGIRPSKMAGPPIAHGRAAGSASALPQMATSLANMGTSATVYQALRPAIKDALIYQPLQPWRKWVQEQARHRALVSADNPIEWEGDPTIYQAASVAGGHVLEWRVRYRSNGYSLGKVAYTLTLAPRQTRRINKISWRRRERATRREATDTADSLAQVTTQSRDYYNAVESTMEEWVSGESSSSASGMAVGIGSAIPTPVPVVVGGGAAHGSASSASSQEGGREASASEHQKLRDAIRQYGEAARQFNSTVITEVSQEEEVEGISETLRNINYCHALTVMYHEILRHMRVDTEFAGVRECLFVPFSITPFGIDKALKWREQLKRGMLDRSLRWALEYLDEVDSAWMNSNIPPGPRMDQPATYMTGSVYVQLSIERPRDRLTDELEDDYYKQWHPLAPLLGMPVRQIVDGLMAVHRDRDNTYQREVASKMAARWADRLVLKVGDQIMPGVNFTLATSYRFGNTVRIDFTAPLQNLSRRQMTDFTVEATQALPIGSVANVKSLSFHYYTDHYDLRVQSPPITADLIDVSTGRPNAGETLHIPTTDWEEQDLQRYIEDAVERLIIHLNSHLVYYHKVIWWLMDRDELYMLLDGFIAPYGRRYENGIWVEDTGRSIASIVEREPMAILGNTLVMRVAAGAFLGIDGHQNPDALRRYYYDSEVRAEPLRISLPTEGLYAQAIMDKCEACEEHFGSTDWVLSNEEPELEALASYLGTRRQTPEDLVPTPLPASIISLQAAPVMPNPSGLDEILKAVTKQDSFRDMAGLANTQSNALNALNKASDLASQFGQRAIDVQKSIQGTVDAKQKISNILKAKSEGLIDNEEAKRQTSKALDEQNTTPADRKLTDEPGMSQAIKKASQVDIQRQTKDGVESIKLGGAPEAEKPAAEPAKPAKTPAAPIFRAPGTNVGSRTADAAASLAAFRGRAGAPKFQVSRNKVADRLQELIDNPDVVKQGRLNLCGQAAVLRTVLRRDPKLVVDFVAGLMENGQGRFGQRLVKPDSDLRNQVYQDSWGSKPAEWVAMSSLRDDGNWLLDYEGTPDEDVSAITLPHEIENWLLDTNLYSSVRNEANLVINENKAHIMGLPQDNNSDNILLVHAHLLRRPASPNTLDDDFILNSFPNHWVVLAGPVSEDNGRLKFKVWSWGEVITLDVPLATFEANYYGAVVARV